MALIESRDVLHFSLRKVCIWLTRIAPCAALGLFAPAATPTDPIVQTASSSQPSSAPAASRTVPTRALPAPFPRFIIEWPPPTTQPATPATAPVAADDPQHSPRATLKTLLVALNDAKTKPPRIVDAVACLDLSNLPAETRVDQGPLLAQQLGEIIDIVFRLQDKSTEDVPDATTGAPYVLHADGDLNITLAQQSDGRWRFTPESVAIIAQVRQSLTRAATTQPIEPAPAPDIPPGFRSARATMVTFLAAHEARDMSGAARCLDLSGLPAPTRDQTGRRLASRLKEVMDRIRGVVEQDVPDRPDGGPYVFHLHEKGRIEIARQEDGERRGYWLFTAATVASIEPLFQEYEPRERVVEPARRRFFDDPSLWVRDRIPPALKERQFGAESWQWIGLLLVLLLGLVTQRIATALIRVFTTYRLGRNRIKVSRPTMAKFVRPFGILALLLTWSGGLQLLDLDARKIAVVWPLMKFSIVASGVWAAYRLIDLLSVYLNALAERTLTKIDDVLVPLLRKTVKIVLLSVGVLVVLETIGVQEASFNTVFAGLGLGGLAFALAAQDTLKNFFGSVTVVVDRPFQVGDWIKMGDVEGEVQSVGLRSTRLRTFLDSEVTIPNANLINANVDNLGRRIYRRFRTIIAVTYDTRAEQLEAFCEGVRELIRRHPYTRKEAYHVYVHDFGESAIQVLLYCFYRTPDWATELRERQRLLLDIIRLAERLGVAFAFPTHTVHVSQESSARSASPLPPVSRDARPALDPAGRPAEPLLLGRNEAAAIVAQFLSPTGEKPPPVTFDSADRPGLNASETRFL